MFGNNKPMFGGSNLSFGSNTSSFGGQQPQQAGAIFGNNNNNNNVTNNNAQSGFGGFSSTARSTSNSLFGNNNSAQNNGAFGQSMGTTQNSPFGSLNSSNTSNVNSFGGSNSMGSFGGNTNNAFNGSNNNINNNSNNNNNNNNNSNNNSTNPPFGLNKPNTGGSLFHSQNNNSAGNSSLFGGQNTNATGTFGNSGTGFGTGLNNNATSMFGAGNNSQNNTAGGMFSNQQSSTFGANSQQGGLFGQQSQNTNNAFGNQSQLGRSSFGSKPVGSGSLFGQSSNSLGSTNNNSNGLFAQTNVSNQTSSNGGLFGQNTINNNTQGMFGQSNNQMQMNGNNSYSLFGKGKATTGFGQQPSNNATSLFGSKPSSGGLFGQQGPTTNTFSNSASGGLFGQNNTQQGSGLFGQNSQTSGGGGPFGQGQQQPNTFNQTGTGSGLFGQNNNQPQQSTGLFGTKPVGPTGSIFGGNPSTQSSSLFGTTNAPTSNTQSQQGSNLFGATKPATMSFGANPTINQPGGGNNIFGAKTASTTGSLFGNNTASTATPSAGGLFGNNTNSSGNTTNTGLFSTKTESQSRPALGGSLFGNSNPNASVIGQNKPAFGSTNQNTGLFGSTNANPSTAISTGGNFGQNNSTFNTGAQNAPPVNNFSQNSFAGTTGSPSLELSIAANNDHLFSKISIPNSITNPVKATSSKLNADMKRNNSLTSAYRLAPKPLFVPSSVNNAKFKRWGKTTEGNAWESRSGNSSAEPESNLLASKKLLFYPDRKYLKHLVIKKNKSLNVVNSNDLEPNKVKLVTFTTEPLSEDNRSSSSLVPSALADEIDSCENVQQEDCDKNSSDIQSAPSSGLTPTHIAENEKIDNRIPGLLSNDVSFFQNNYYISPSMETLGNKSLIELRRISNLVIGHRDYGKVEFLEPVDLSNTPLDTLCDDIVIFGQKSCSIYENCSIKPKKGEGINVRCRVTLYSCFPIDKETRKPIKNMIHPLLKRSIAKLKENPVYKFESYDPVTGTYSYTVDSPVLP
ncbi:hypothetical protein SKDZ_11G1400 [Saccharomyces kudriavzevii ZP591]|nr:hypothetical protein SKDZ_11G1400 [Saccharomyces kudriavzevii ZP591]